MVKNPQIIEPDLCNVFSPEWLCETARETELVIRERKIDPVIFWGLSYRI